MPTPSAARTAAATIAAVAACALALSLGVFAGPPARAADPPPDGGGFAGRSGDAAGGPRDAADAPAAARDLDVGPTLPGIDVSHWQGTIDWGRVADAGKRFVFMKATDGHDFVDPTLQANRAGARANGLAVGFYHFARPDPSQGDAVEEARWFVSRTDPRPGQLLPVLDLETSTGLDQEGVTLWARRFVVEVKRLTGVTPLVYTSPYGWATRTDDSRALARDGAPLWIAHWGVEEPTLPAGDWDGRGWRVWQHTSSGHVAGIQGRVDLDVVAGRSLGPITIRRLSLDVRGGAGKMVSVPAGLGCRATCTKNVDPDAQVTLTAMPDEGASFAGWDGACSGGGDTCTITMRGNRSVQARFVTDATPPSPSFDVAGGFRGPVLVAFDEPVRGVGPANVVLRRPGGDPLDVTRRCADVDGRAVPCAGLLRSVELTPRQVLVPGRTYEVVVDPPGAAPVVDRVGNPVPTTAHAWAAPTTVESTHAPVTVRPGRAWQVGRHTAASGSAFSLAERAGADLTMRFDGIGIDLVVVTGPNRGRARIEVDGHGIRVVDLFTPQRTFGVVERVDGLDDRTHVVRVEVLGRRSVTAHGRWVAIDRLEVLTG